MVDRECIFRVRPLYAVDTIAYIKWRRACVPRAVIYLIARCGGGGGNMFLVAYTLFLCVCVCDRGLRE